jgi:hypothetical protein
MSAGIHGARAVPPHSATADRFHQKIDSRAGGDSILSDNWAEGARPESDLHYTFCARMKFEMVRQPQNGDIGKHILTQSVLSVLLSVLSSEQAENGRQQRSERRLGDARSLLE